MKPSAPLGNLKGPELHRNKPWRLFVPALRFQCSPPAQQFSPEFFHHDQLKILVAMKHHHISLARSGAAKAFEMCVLSLCTFQQPGFSQKRRGIKEGFHELLVIGTVGTYGQELLAEPRAAHGTASLLELHEACPNCRAPTSETAVTCGEVLKRWRIEED